MNVKFNCNTSILVCYDVMDYEEMNREHLAKYLLGKFDNGIVVSNAMVNERQTLLNWLPFIDRIFLYSADGVKLEQNSMAISFSSGTDEMVYLRVSDNLYRFITQR